MKDERAEVWVRVYAAVVAQEAGVIAYYAACAAVAGFDQWREDNPPEGHATNDAEPDEGPAPDGWFYPYDGHRMPFPSQFIRIRTASGAEGCNVAGNFDFSRGGDTQIIAWKPEQR